MFFEGYTEKLWGRHPREIDASWGKQRTKELSIFGILRDMFSKVFVSREQRSKRVQTSLIEEFRYPKYGPGQLWETVAAEVEKMGGKILLRRGGSGPDHGGRARQEPALPRRKRRAHGGGGRLLLLHAGEGPGGRA